jgi:hypothetical protein
MKTAILTLLSLMLSALAGTVGAAEPAPPAAAPATTAAQTAPPRKLDLRAPDITKLFTPEQLNNVLEASRTDNIEEVEVEAVRGRTRAPSTPEVWGGLAAPVWALIHPLQAWRIFAPLPPDRTGMMARSPPDYTTGFLEPAAVPPPNF